MTRDHSPATPLQRCVTYDVVYAACRCGRSDRGATGRRAAAEESFDTPDDEGFTPPSHVFFENEDLIRALNDPRRGVDDEAVAQRLFGSLIEATLIALVPDDQDIELSDEGVVERDLEVSFVLVSHPEVDGEIVPVFTDEGAVSAFTPDGGQYIALAVRDMFPLLAAGVNGAPNIVINPGSDEALLLTPAMVEDIVDAVRGYKLEVVDPEGPIVVGLPSEPLPEECLERLHEVLAARPDIVRCVELQWYMPERHEEPSLVLALEVDDDLTGNARRSALSAVWAELSPTLRLLERTVEMVDLDAQRSNFGELIDRARVLYERDAG